MRWRVEALDKTVEREIAALSDGLQADLMRIAELLQTHGPHLVGMLYVRPLGRKFWEMRLRDETGIARAIYVAATGRRLVILHVFRKKTQETPQQAIRLALKRMERL